MLKNGESWLRKWFHKEHGKGLGQLGVLLCLGVLFLFLGQTMFAEDTKAEIQIQVEPENPYAEKMAMESQVAEILSKVEGAGMVQVMITYQDNGIFQVATEESLETTESYSTDTQEKTEKSETTILLTEDAEGATTPFLLQSTEPSIEGIVIVAEGGGNAVISQNLFIAAQALFDVPAHKIAILQMRA
ncbi:hypothetical protein [Chakrabartyella piscis]|uniref:hypothetical protein n=1 Tax=Chakrabartyella piscis TaxID=2918914 RepID=UPI002958AA17|nr:hypothetical protein [Chakrabartyella piscis]